MTTTLRLAYEEVREVDGDDLGSVMGFNVAGHLDDREIELFLADEVSSEWDELEVTS